jgi:hypothetical protein
MDLAIDVREFNEARWWSPSDVRAADSETFDPQFLRFIEKTSS